MNTSLALINANIQFGQKYAGVEKAAQFLKDFGMYSDLYNHFDSVRNYMIRENREHCYHDLYHVTQSALKDNDFSFIVGGDHSIAFSTIPALLNEHPDLKVIWIDAHADMNTPATSPSGNLHGMPLAGICGIFDPQEKLGGFSWITSFIKPENVFILGTRDMDRGEKEILQSHNFQMYSFADIQKRGLIEILAEIKLQIGASPVHISFDVDSIDPLLAPATGVPVSDGFHLQDISTMGHVFGTLNTVSLELVEFNPDIDQSKTAVNATAQALTHFYRSFFRTFCSQQLRRQKSVGF